MSGTADRSASGMPPENEAELTKQIMLEHRFQKGWKRKPRTKTPNPPSR